MGSWSNHGQESGKGILGTGIRIGDILNLKKNLTNEGRRGLILRSHHFFVFQSSMPIEVKIRKGEPVDRAIRRLKKKLDREGVIRDVRAKRYFEKPSEVRRRKRKVAAFTNMLRNRYNQ